MSKQLSKRKKKLAVRRAKFEPLSDKTGYRKPGSMNGRKT